MPLLALLGGWLAKSALMTSPVGGFLKGFGSLVRRIPWQVWLTLAIVAAAAGGYFWVKHEIHQAYASGHKDGYAQAVREINAREAKKVAPLVNAKTVADTKNITTNQQARKSYDAGNAHVDRNVADLLSVYDRPSGHAGGSAQSGVPAAAVPAGADPAQPRADDGLAQAGGEVAAEPTITVPAKQLITRAGICDRDFIALKAWEQAYAGWRVNYDQWLAKTKAIAPQPSQ
jgi:hypothetical protein